MCLCFLHVCTVVFIVGSPMYVKMAPQGNIMVKVCKCIGVSLCLASFSLIMYLNGFE